MRRGTKLLRSSKPRRRRRVAALVGAVALLAAGVLTGCGATTTSREGASVERGRELFQQQCGQCHVLGDAGTAGEIGPNLDDGFTAREQGFEESTYFEVVLEQMAIPGEPMPDFDEPGTDTYLPEEDRIAIASYVARVAGKPVEDRGPATDDPKAIFAASCGSCHTLADAGTTGTVGPSLDESNVDVQAAAEQIANGGGGMPAFRGQLSDEQIRALAEYVVQARQGR
jgi:mono/diheme cytochrome c family protein